MSPKVSEAYLEARRDAILDAALSCFSKYGLDGATLRDISAEAGLSLGAIYNYFPAKAEIIEALRERSIREEPTLRDRSAAAEDPLRIERDIQFIFERMQQPESEDANRTAVFLWANALLSEPTRRGQLESLSDLKALWIAEYQRRQETGQVKPELDPTYIYHAVLALIIGFQVQKAWEPDLDARELAKVARAALLGDFWIGVPQTQTESEGNDVSA